MLAFGDELVDLKLLDDPNFGWLSPGGRDSAAASLPAAQDGSVAQLAGSRAGCQAVLRACALAYWLSRRVPGPRPQASRWAAAQSPSASQ